MNSLTFVDKSSWKDGPWKNEPDKVVWIDPETGLDCIARRGPSGAWCGYVGVDKNHTFFGMHYDSDPLYEIEIHGGLTYSDPCDEENKETGVCHISDKEDDLWWFGFDCAHCGDITPAWLHIYTKDFLEFSHSHENPTYKDLEYIKKETKKLAKQLKDRS